MERSGNIRRTCQVDIINECVLQSKEQSNDGRWVGERRRQGCSPVVHEAEEGHGIVESEHLDLKWGQNRRRNKSQF